MVCMYVLKDRILLCIYPTMEVEILLSLTNVGILGICHT